MNSDLPRGLFLELNDLLLLQNLVSSQVSVEVLGYLPNYEEVVVVELRSHLRYWTVVRSKQLYEIRSHSAADLSGPSRLVMTLNDMRDVMAVLDRLISSAFSEHR